MNVSDAGFIGRGISFELGGRHLPDFALLVALKDTLLLKLGYERLGDFDFSWGGSVRSDGRSDTEIPRRSTAKSGLYC